MNRFSAPVAIVAAFAVSACSSTSPVEEAEITRVEVSPRAGTLAVGESLDLSAVASDADGNVLDDVVFDWRSSDPSKVIVEDGTLTAIAAGDAEITATAGGKTGKAVMTVTEEMETEDPAFELILSADKLPVLQGGTATVTATVKRKNGFAGAVVLSEAGLPSGASFEPLTIAADADSGSLTLSALASAPHSLPTTVTVKAQSGDLTVSRPLTITVYGPPGSLDTSFAGGKVVVPMGASDDYAHAMAVQADGKIVVAGRSYENYGDFAVLRLSRDGVPDETFGEGGKVVTSIGSGSETAYAVAVQEDGKIVVAGSTDGGETGLDFGVVRYLSDGRLDQGFGAGGKVTVPFGDDSDTAFAVLVQPDGKIVVGGDSSQGSSTSGVDFAIARLNEDGSLDEAFGEGGKVLTSLASYAGRDSIYALALQTVQGQTRLLAAGGEGDFVVARYRPDGELDASFGDGGKRIGLLGSTIGAARGIAIDGEGNVLVAGHMHHDFALVRLDETGELDEAFGDGGVVVTPVSDTNWDEAHGLAVEADGKIVLGGWSYEGAGSSGNFAMVRYNGAGALDATFGDGGIVVTEVAAPTKRDEAAAVLLQSDERVPTVRVLLAGYASDTNGDFAVTRYWR